MKRGRGEKEETYSLLKHTALTKITAINSLLGLEIRSGRVRDQELALHVLLHLRPVLLLLLLEGPVPLLERVPETVDLLPFGRVGGAGLVDEHLQPIAKMAALVVELLNHGVELLLLPDEVGRREGLRLLLADAVDILVHLAELLIGFGDFAEEGVAAGLGCWSCPVAAVAGSLCAIPAI